jgi:hypothetical protein
MGKRTEAQARHRAPCRLTCTRPAAFTEVHHVIPWDPDGETNLDNLCLLCAHHHRNFQPAGWTVVMTGGAPEWIPPATVDPHRRPQRNRAHHHDIDFTA